MHRRAYRRVVVIAGTAVLATAGVIGQGTAAQAAPTATITPVLTGLAAPRGIAFDGSGAMYVVQSGVAGKGAAGMTHSGRVSKYRWGHTTPAWTDRFRSLYASEDPSAPPDVLGPEGISALGHGCTGRHDDEHNGCQIRLIMSESTVGTLAVSNGKVYDPQAGHLYRLNGRTGAVTDKSDVGAQQWAFTYANQKLFPSDFPDSNPYGVLVTRGPSGTRTFVADAGANTISEVMRNGRTRIIAYIPNETAAPFRDATPTCIAQGPDGYLYVGTLHFVSNLFVNNGGQSDVWRVNPNANYPTAPKLWASGLSTVTGCTFDRRGNFWATEMFAGGLSATPPGDVVEIPFAHPTDLDRFGAGQLAVPGDIAQGPDGAMYVTVGSSAPGVNGGVMRIAVH